MTVSSQLSNRHGVLDAGTSDSVRRFRVSRSGCSAAALTLQPGRQADPEHYTRQSRKTKSSQQLNSHSVLVAGTSDSVWIRLPHQDWGKADKLAQIIRRAVMRNYGINTSSAVVAGTSGGVRRFRVSRPGCPATTKTGAHLAGSHARLSHSNSQNSQKQSQCCCVQGPLAVSEDSECLDQVAQRPHQDWS